MARCCNIKSSEQTVTEMHLGHLDDIVDKKTRHFNRLSYFGDVDDIRYLQSHKIYKNTDLEGKLNELTMHNAASVKASRWCGIWLEYTLIFVNVTLSIGVNAFATEGFWKATELISTTPPPLYSTTSVYSTTSPP